MREKKEIYLKIVGEKTKKLFSKIVKIMFYLKIINGDIVKTHLKIIKK